MQFNLTVIVCGLLIGAALLFLLAYTSDRHAQALKQINSQLNSINWPIPADPRKGNRE